MTRRSWIRSCGFTSELCRSANPLIQWFATLGEAQNGKVGADRYRHDRGIEAATSEVLAVTSLARAVSGEATIGDVGALTWMMLRQVIPCVSMGIFLHDENWTRQ